MTRAVLAAVGLLLVAIMVPLLLLGGGTSSTAAAGPGTCSSAAVGRQTPAMSYVPACGYPDNFTNPPGECTSWAAHNWPGHHGRGVTWSGDAWQWFANAAAAGYTTSATPSVGAIVVIEQSSDDAGEWGHVAIVTAVATSSITVSEMNWQTRFVVDTRTISWPVGGIAGFIPVPTDAFT